MKKYIISIVFASVVHYMQVAASSIVLHPAEQIKVALLRFEEKALSYNNTKSLIERIEVSNSGTLNCDPRSEQDDVLLYAIRSCSLDSIKLLVDCKADLSFPQSPSSTCVLAGRLGDGKQQEVLEIAQYFKEQKVKMERCKLASLEVECNGCKEKCQKQENECNARIDALLNLINTYSKATDTAEKKTDADGDADSTTCTIWCGSSAKKLEYGTT